jgi:putative two-component system response regulator
MSGISAKYQAFIEDQREKLKTYDATRPPDHPYNFYSHSSRVAKDMRKLALAMGQSEDRAEELFQATLVHDIGKRLLPVAIWDVPGKPNEKIRKQRRKHTILGVSIVDEHFGADNHDPFIDLMRDLIAHHHEAMDGSGWMKIKGNDLSLEARMLCICDAFDGYSVWRPHFGGRDISPDGVLHRMTVEKAGQFDKDIMEIFSKATHAAV